jgi:hypothetical protein
MEAFRELIHRWETAAALVGSPEPRRIVVAEPRS